MQVELSGREPEQVARRARDDQSVLAIARPRLEQPPQVRHIGLKHICCGVGRPLAPQLVDQPLGRNNLVGVQDENQEQSALLGGADGDHASPFLGDLEGPENPKLHAAPSVRPLPATRP